MRLGKSGSFIVAACILVVACVSSCRKQQTLSSGGILKFSTDTLKFDTVFTAAGSFTTGLLIFNDQNEPINISSVKLKNGNASYFHLNVDGFKGNYITNLKVAPHDSIYVFATVNIDPTDTLTPFIVTDELIATLNGREFSVPFTAYGQNAHYIVGDSLKASSTPYNWKTDLPYVVVHSCVVGSGATLNIPAGCRVYMHQDARFFVFGTLNINTGAARKEDTVLVQGDRLDRRYFGYIGYPGEWGGIYVVNGGVCNMMNTTLTNCGGSTPYHNYSIQSAAVEVDSGGKANIDKCVIKNSIGHGIFSFQGEVTATNSLVAGCGGEALAVVLGGRDSFTNCTFANYSSNVLSHINNPTVGIVNWLQISQTEYVYADVNVVMRNCLVWGSLDSELVADTSYSPAGIKARLLFDHCNLKKGKNDQAFVQLQTCINKDPDFKNTDKFDFHVPQTSPVVNAGTGAYPPLRFDDLDWKARSGFDIGCYQHSQ